MTDKIPTHDDKGYPLNNNVDFSTFYTTPEEFVQIPVAAYNMFGIDPDRYLVSTHGRFYNKLLNSYIPRNLVPDRNRYIILAFKSPDNRDIFLPAHRVICFVFNGFLGIYPIGEMIVINHKDGIMWHNEPYNLEWVTNSENVIHAQNNNWVAKASGERNGYAALTDDIYHEICRLTELGHMPAEINNMINCGKDITNIAQKIRKGQCAIHIAEQYDFSNIPKHNYSKFSDDEVVKICELLSQNIDIDTIINILFDKNNISIEQYQNYYSKIINILNRKRFINISKDYLF